MERPASKVSALLSLPSVQAVFIQCVSLVMALLVLQVLRVQAGIVINIAIFVILQGAVAALLARWRQMAPWWLLIHFLFLPALSATHALDLPPSLFLVGFILLLGLYWSTFRTQVPLYLSGTAIWHCVGRLLPQRQAIRFLDVGSGLGGLVLHLGRQRPDSSISGIEVAPLPWLISWLRARFEGNGSKLVRGDYGNLDFAGYDVIFAYLSPAAMPSLWEKAAMQMRPGTLLLSCEFPVAGVAPDIEVQTEPGGRVMYGWRM